MAKAVTNPRTAIKERLAWHWQTAKGTTSTDNATARRLWGTIDIDPGYVYVDPKGSTGTAYERASITKVGMFPKFSGTLHVTLDTLPLLLESVTGGQATCSNAQLTEANDGSNQLSSWSLTGVRPSHNTAADSIIYYVKLADSAGTRTVGLYKEVGLTNKVCEGSVVGDGVITLAETNNSGLSGSVTVAWTIDDSDITLTIATIAQPILSAGTWSRFFTLWKDTGEEYETLTDCVITKVEFESGVQEGLMAKIEGWAMNHARTDGAFTLNTGMTDMDVYAHEHVQLRRDPDGTPAEVAPDRVSLVVENKARPVFSGSDVPIEFIKDGVILSGQVEGVYGDEFQTFFTRGIADNYEDMDIQYTRSSKTLTLTLDNVKYLEPKLPGSDGESIASHIVPFTVRQDVASSPDEPLAITWQP